MEDNKEIEKECCHDECECQNNESKCTCDSVKEKKTFRKKEDKQKIEINNLKDEIANLTNKLLYSQAEFANFKKRKELETSNMLKYANLDIVSEILSILDNFERAIKLDDADLTDELSKFLDGFKMIYSHLVEILKKFDVVEIDCLNKPFDPNYAEALMVGTKEGTEAGIVIEVFQKGYMLKDRMVRPALVKVSE